MGVHSRNRRPDRLQPVGGGRLLAGNLRVDEKAQHDLSCQRSRLLVQSRTGVRGSSRVEPGLRGTITPPQRSQRRQAVRALCGSEPRSELSLAIRLVHGSCSAASTVNPSPYQVPFLVQPAASARPASGRSPHPGAPDVTCSRCIPPGWTGPAPARPERWGWPATAWRSGNYPMLRLVRQKVGCRSAC